MALKRLGPIGLVAMIVGLYAGWQAFPNGSQAFYVLSGGFITATMLMIWRDRGPYWGPACALGALLGALQSTCGVLFSSIADGLEFLCDKGTAKPVSALTLWLTCMVVAYYSIRRRPKWK